MKVATATAAPAALHTFSEAMQRIIDGARLTRVEWDNPKVCIFLVDGLLKIRLADGSLKALIVSDGDMQAVDWHDVSAEDIPPRYVVHG